MQDEKLQDPGIPASTPILKKLDNFWYHYKWHTLAALFVLAVLVIGIVQSCSRKGAEYRILYGGDRVIGRETGQAICRVFSDLADQEADVQLSHYFIDLSEGSGMGGVVGQNLDQFDGEVQTGDAMLYLLSPTLHERILESNGGIVPLDEYFPQGLPEGVTFYDEGHTAILLSSLPAYQLEGLRDLPEDTLICLRSPVSLSGLLNRDRAEEQHRAYAALLVALIFWSPEE